MPDSLNELFFGEIPVDNAGGAAVNVNGQGGANKQDEFVEIQYNSDTSIDLDCYEIWSDKNGLLHSFAAGDEIVAGGKATVVGSYTNPPAGFTEPTGTITRQVQTVAFWKVMKATNLTPSILSHPAGTTSSLHMGKTYRPQAHYPLVFRRAGPCMAMAKPLALARAMARRYCEMPMVTLSKERQPREHLARFALFRVP